MENQKPNGSDSEEDVPEASPSKKNERKIMGRRSLDSHCEIERKRREKMLTYILELRDSIPACKSLPCSRNKPDKITILRMAAEHLRTLQGNGNTGGQNSFLSNLELKHLILEAANGFLFVVNCEIGKVLYVTESIQSVLNCRPSDWIEGCIYDKIHFGDVEHFKQQLSIPQKKPQVVVDLKSGSIKKEKHSNQEIRRNFICRMKMGKLETHNDDRERKIFLPNYVFIHCSGYIKKVPNPSKELNNSSNLIAIGRLQTTSSPTSTNPSEFVSRHSLDGTFHFVDERVTNLLGYSPKDLLDKPFHDFFHPTEQVYLQESFKQVIALKGQLMNVVGRFRAKNSEWTLLRMSMHAFVNPWSNEIEFIMCTNRVTKNYVRNNEESGNVTNNYENPLDGTSILPNNLCKGQDISSHIHLPIPNPQIPGSFSNTRPTANQQFIKKQEVIQQTESSWSLDATQVSSSPCSEEAITAIKQCDNSKEDLEDILDILIKDENTVLGSLDLINHILK